MAVDRGFGFGFGCGGCCSEVGCGIGDLDLPDGCDGLGLSCGGACWGFGSDFGSCCGGVFRGPGLGFDGVSRCLLMRTTRMKTLAEA